jgi:hypothetical protein
MQRDCGAPAARRNDDIRICTRGKGRSRRTWGALPQRKPQAHFRAAARVVFGASGAATCTVEFLRHIDAALPRLVSDASVFSRGLEQKPVSRNGGGGLKEPVEAKRG